MTLPEVCKMTYDDNVNGFQTKIRSNSQNHLSLFPLLTRKVHLLVHCYVNLTTGKKDVASTLIKKAPNIHVQSIHVHVYRCTKEIKHIKGKSDIF